MSSDAVAVSVRGLAKSYTIRHNATDHITLAELALDRLRHPLRRAAREEFWALRDVSFDVEPGEVLGLIGRNGAGKSTLLKVMSRITDPTRGEVHLWGRVGSLLEVGSGFHAELTGRENVYLNGAILGMSRREIAKKFDAIVDFAGVEKFLDTPVKRYSSGMYVRLAFAVAAHLDTEILLLDEVLAVGDGDFQAKCLGKVADLARSGRAVMLVSHNMVTVRQFASRAILLDRGRIVQSGSTESVIAHYTAEGAGVVTEADVSSMLRYDPSFGSRVRITKVRLNHERGIVSAEADLSYTVWLQSREDVGPLRISQSIQTADGRVVGVSITDASVFLQRGQVAEFDVELPRPALAPGRYSLALGVGFGDNSTGLVDLDVVLDSVHFEVLPPVTDDGRVMSWNESWGSVRFATPRIVNPDDRPRSATPPPLAAEPLS
jgi:lipopolysaccharide transport system ATP-binding protein